jgi:hypothetical protein
MMHHVIRFRGQPIQRRFQLATFGFHLSRVGVPRHPNRTSPEKDTLSKWVWDQEAIPTGEEFFFEQLNVSGNIGRPVTFAI